MMRSLDLVQIRTTKNIKYLSSEKGQVTTPHGNWSVVGFVGGDALIAKDGNLARVPVADLTLIGQFQTPQ